MKKPKLKVKCLKVSQLLQQNLNRMWIWILIFLTCANAISKRTIQKCPSELEKLTSIWVWGMYYVRLIYKLLPIWVRAIYLNICAWIFFLLAPISTGFGSASGVLPSLPVTPPPPSSSEKPWWEWWLCLARDQSCLQDVHLSTCFLEFIQSVMWPSTIIQGLCSVTLSSESRERAKMGRDT